MILSLTYACSIDARQHRSSQATSDVDEEYVMVKEPSTNNGKDALIVDKKTAVFVSPDSAMIEKRKNELGDETFYIGLDDYAFHLMRAHEFLDSMKLPILENQDERVLKFVRKDKSEQMVELDSQPELWAIYFFDPAKEAKKVDMTIIDQEYSDYFE